MSYFIQSPAKRDALTKSARILQDAPQASTALRKITDAAKDLRFGSPISAVVNNYHFPSETEVRHFFTAYLAQRREGQLDEAELKHAILNTINCRPADLDDNEEGARGAFHRIFEELVRQITKTAAENIPLVNFFVGPTGAGKTAFSKGLFTVCQQDFWKEGIVPSRVEFSKFGKGRHGSYSDPFARDPEFLAYVRRCQLRDLLIYLCSSGCVDGEQLRSSIASLGFAQGGAERILLDLVDKTREITVDGEVCILSGAVRTLFDNAVRDLAGKRDAVLSALSKHHQVRYLVSFDGFDSTKIEHFLFERKRNVPITLIAQMVKGLHHKAFYPEMDDCPLDSHYLVYMRDTTFAGLRTELFGDVGGHISFPVYWIVPPTYAMLVQNVAAHITGSRDVAENQADTLFRDIVREFDRHIFDDPSLRAEHHLPFVFGSSGRRMKTHIRNQLISALQRVCDQLRLKRERSGIDARTVWTELVGHHSISKLPHYVVLQDLFLNEARQMIPKLELDSEVVSELLAENDFDELQKHIVDTDEASGTFGCLFNYFYRVTLAAGDKIQPGMLLLIRTIQYVDRNPHCYAGEVHTFLTSIGYDIPKPVTDFCLFIAIRCEAVKWDSSRGASAIGDVPLFSTITGKIALRKLLFSITYLSEAILSSIQIDRTLTGRLRDRESSNLVWVADCIFNASIALYLIGEIEAIELVKARESHTEVDDYMLYRPLRRSLSREARSIVMGGHRPILDRWEINRERLEALKPRYPNLVMLGGDDGPSR